MSEPIRRNRNQVFSRFLPGAVMTIDGETVEVKRHFVAGAGGDSNSEAYLRRLLSTELNGWTYRDPAFRSLRTNPDTSTFELVKSEKVQGHPVYLYECKSCHAVQDAGTGIERGNCKRCKKELRVLPFVLIHTCGKIKPMRIPECTKHKRDFIKLERYGKQRWVCGICGHSEGAFGGNCGKGCELVLQGAPLDRGDKNLLRRNVSDPGIHNAQILTLLNPPVRGIAELLKDFPEQSRLLFLADYLGLLPPFAQRLDEAVAVLGDLATVKPQPTRAEGKLIRDLRAMGIPEWKIADLIKSAQDDVAAENPRLVLVKQLERALEEVSASLGGTGGTEALDPAFHAMLRDHVLGCRLEGAISIQEVAEELQHVTGPRTVYAGRVSEAQRLCVASGIEQVLYLARLPIRSAAYGYTRVKSRPGDKVLLKAFPPIISTKGTSHQVYPIFIADANTEALMFSLSSKRMIAWLVANSCLSEAEASALTTERQRKVWLLLHQGTISFDTVPETVTPVSWAIASCVHSVSHLLVGQIASQSSFGETSLSEMLFPATLSTVIYVNQRSEFSLGGLRTFLEQRLGVALRAALEDEGCMLDPGCEDDGGACVGCLFIPEVSCRLLNAALSRHLLFGGPPTGDLAFLFDRPITGYFHPSVAAMAERLYPS